MSRYDDEEKDPLDFSQYIPKWKEDDDEDDDDNAFFYEEGMFDNFDPEQIITETDMDTIRVKHIKCALDNLVHETKTNGPFSKEQIAEELQIVLIEEALEELVHKGLVQMGPDGKFSLTEDGKKVAQSKLNHPNKWIGE